MHQTKICLIGNNLSNGGADKIHAILSNFFFSKNIDVHNVIITDEITYDFSGKLLNLGKLKDNGNGLLNNLKRFLVLKKYIKQHNFDYIIDVRARNNQLKEFLIAKMIYKVPYVVMIHSYNTDWYFPKNNLIAKTIFSNAYGIVCVSKEIEAKVKEKYGYKNLKTIYNPLEIDKITVLSKENIDLDFEYVLAAGRMVFDNNKKFDKMIKAYAASRLPMKNIKLVLLGNGPQKKYLQELAKSEEVEDKVVFLDFQKNPFKFIKRAKFTLLTSKHEGLPNIITESLACGVPVVSFDCKSGPNELIDNGKNGLLVKDQDFKEFVHAMNEMDQNEALLATCKENALESIQRFSVEKIGAEWLEYLKINK